MITSTHTLDELAQAAAKALIAATPLTVRMVSDKRPANWPLPIKRSKPADPGDDSIQEYRVAAIVEYIETMRGRKATGKPEDTEEDDDLI